MGGRKKKFIEKKRSATFQLVARDTSGPDPHGPSPASGRVFVRVDSNPYAVDDDSIFADAPSSPCGLPPSHPSALPDHVRREILDLGLPDDGYNYLLHLREIDHAGAGAAYFHNDRARMDLVPADVRAYDASRLHVAAVDDAECGSTCLVASRTVGVRVGRALDPDVAKLLEDDGEGSLLGSDVEDLEEDFVVVANRKDEEEVESSPKTRPEGVEGWLEDVEEDFREGGGYEPFPESRLVDGDAGEVARMRRLLDAQFDLLALREYDDESDSDDAEYMGKEVDPLAAKLNDALKDYSLDDLELEDKYRVPADYIHCGQLSKTDMLATSSVELIRKCAEYAEMYSHDDKDEREVVLCQESSDESEIWDCETVVSTYTNLDNHPGKISAPEKHAKKLSEFSNGKDKIISLRGKSKIPLDFLPNNKKISTEKVKRVEPDQIHKRPQDESKEAKKERKSAVKEERREARRTKKELKQLYRSEGQKAQQVAAFAGPSSIHLL